MSKKKVDETMSDEDDDELFSYLKTAHTVKHVKVDPVKTCEIVDTFATESANKSNRLDSNKVLSRNSRESHELVQGKVNAIGQNHPITPLICVSDDSARIQEKTQAKHLSNKVCIDLTSNISTDICKKTCVNKADLFCTDGTNVRPNLNSNERPPLNAAVLDSNIKPDGRQLRVTGIDLTEDLEHKIDSETAPTDIKFTQSVYNVEHKCWDNDKLGNDKLGNDKLGNDKLGNDKLGNDKLGNDKLGNDKLGNDKLGNDKLGNDKLGNDKLGNDKLGNDKLGNDKLGNDKLGNDKLGNDKLGNDKLGNDKLGNDKLGNDKGVRDCSSQAESSSQENKFYLINERDWNKLFSSIQKNKQEFDLPETNDESPANICDYERNKNVCAIEAAPNIIPGNYSNSANETSFRHIPAVSTEPAVTKSTEKQAPGTGSQNVEVVYVRIEDGKLTCDKISSPVKNVTGQDPRTFDYSEDIKTKFADVRLGYNDDTSVAIDNHVHRTTDETASVEDGFNGRFVRINNTLTRVFNKNDQQVLEPVLSRDGELLQDASNDDPENYDEIDSETAFFIDLNDWNETHGLSDNDLKIYPISIQDDSYAFLNESESCEQFVACPVNEYQEGEVKVNPEFTNSNILKSNETLISAQVGKHSDVDSKTFSGKSPMKMITFSPRKLFKSPEKNTSPMKGNIMKLSPMQAKALQISPHKAEVSNTSAQIIKDLWKNFKSDSVKRKLLGAVSSEDDIDNGKQDVYQSEDVTECIDSDSDSDGDNFLNYLRRGKTKKTSTSRNVRNSKKHRDQSYLPIDFSAEAVLNNNRSMSVQTNLNENDAAVDADQLIAKRLNTRVNKSKLELLDRPEIYQDKQGLHIELPEETDLNEGGIVKLTEKNETRKELMSKREFDSATEKHLKKNPDNKVSDNNSKTIEKKTCVDVPSGNAKKDKAGARKRKAKSGEINEIKAKTAKVSNVEISLFTRKGSKVGTSRARKTPTKPKSPSQTQIKRNKSSVSNGKSKICVNVVNTNRTIIVADKEKSCSTNDCENDMSELTVGDCEKLDTAGRSEKKGLKSDAHTKAVGPKRETKISKPGKKKSSTHKENTGLKVEKEKENADNIEGTSVTEKSTGKVMKRKSSSKVKQSNVRKKKCEGEKKSNNKRKDKKLDNDKEGTNMCNVKEENKVKGNNKGKKNVKKKQQCSGVIKTMDEVLLDSAETDDINKWGNIKNNKVDFLERLFHMKLKEATNLDDGVKVNDKPSSISDTQNIAGKVTCEHSVNEMTTSDIKILEAHHKDGTADVQNKRSGKSVRKQRTPHKLEVKLSFPQHCDFDTNIKAAENVTNGKTDKASFTLRQSDNVSDKFDDKDHSKMLNSDKIVDVKVNCTEKKERKRRKKADKHDVNISIPDLSDVGENKSDTVCDKPADKIHSKRMKSDKIIDDDTCAIASCSGLKSKARTKRSSFKQKGVSKQDSKKSNETQRRLKKIRSLKQLHSTLKPVSKRKAESWKEHLQDEAFKFDFDKDVYKTHTPLNVKAMIKNILKPLSSDEGGKKKRQKDKNKLRKHLVKVARSKQKTRNTSGARASESDDVWMSDSGPGGSYPAFKFATEHQTLELYLM